MQIAGGISAARNKYEMQAAARGRSHRKGGKVEPEEGGGRVGVAEVVEVEGGGGGGRGGGWRAAQEVVGAVPAVVVGGGGGRRGWRWRVVRWWRSIQAEGSVAMGSEIGRAHV